MIPGANGRVAMMWRRQKSGRKCPMATITLDCRLRLWPKIVITYVDAVIDGSVIDINRKEIHTGAAKRHAFPILSEEDVKMKAIANTCHDTDIQSVLREKQEESSRTNGALCRWT